MAPPVPKNKNEPTAAHHTPTIGIDFDGTIADTNQVKAQWIKKKLGIDLPPPKCDRSQCVPIIGLDNYEKMAAFVYDEAGTHAAPPVSGALKALEGRRDDDQPSIENPFYFLGGDGFWQVEKPDGGRLYQPGNASSPPSMSILRSAAGRFDSQLWELMQSPASRSQLREALVARYFPDDRREIQSLLVAPEPPRGLQLNEVVEQARSGAFRQTILEVYDYTCAACGLRVRLNDGFSLVEAAHLIPFNVTRDDKPNNGLALCPNHHRAMDRFLIGPCPDRKHRAGIWRVGPALDPRIEGQKALVALDGQRVIAPTEEKFYPAIESLRWREQRFTTKY
jgi:putative restriction endonuclease